VPDAQRPLVRQSEVISALSRAIDLTEGQPMGHAARTCVIGMRLAGELGLDAADRSALFYALLLKDVGCSSTAARVSQILGGDDLDFKGGLKRIDWNRPSEAVRHIVGSTAGSPASRLRRVAAVARSGARLGDELVGLRCDRGAQILRLLAFPDATVIAMASADEHWDGRGKSAGLRGDEIAPLGRILGLAQTAEVFFATGGPEAAADVVRRRRGTWFDPALADLFEHVARDAAFWERVASPDVAMHVAALEPAERVVLADDDRLDLIAEAFGRVVDAKSPFTSRHSERVAETAAGIGAVLGLGAAELRDLRRAGLLHDLGKLGVPNTVLDKPGKLTPAEWELMRRHPAYTAEVLAHVECLRPIAGTAASHHERLDGSGYHRGLDAAELPLPARILAVADVYDALAHDRPYHAAMPIERVLEILAADAGTRLDSESIGALRALLAAGAGAGSALAA
jgi:HD-GYP domain-containing protein (c-di-GMP phosphodiesterase class II)